MKTLLLTTLLTLTLLCAKEYKVVFDLTTDTASTVENRVLHNINGLKHYYAKTGDRLKAAVVISGGAYEFFEKDSSIKEIATDISKVAKVEVCSVGMKKRNIKKSDMLPFVIPAFNKTEALIRYQNEGYAYVPVK